MAQDKDLLKALGYSDDMISRMAKWDLVIERLKAKNTDIDVEQLYKIHFNILGIKVDDAAPTQIKAELEREFFRVFSDNHL